MKKITVSAAIATFNEKSNIEKCIKSLKQFADEIVVVDGNSTDGTGEIARKLGAKVIGTTNKQMFHINKNVAIENCTGDWIFLIDADERVTPELAQEIKKKVNQNPTQNGFWVKRANWFLGAFIKKGGTYPDPVIRLFKNGKGILPQETVHEQVQIEGSVATLKNDLIHFADPTFSRYLKRADRYSTLTSREIERVNPERGVRGVVQYLIFKPLFTFFSIYLRHRGFSDGFRGFVWAFFSSSHYFLAYVKYWEKGIKR